MEARLLAAVDETMPRFNAKVIEGYHKEQFDLGHKIYEHYLKQLFKYLPKKGVRYKGLELVQPKEFIRMLNESSTKICDIHRETVYPIKHHFEYCDHGTWVPLKPTYQMLSYTNEYGDIFLRNSFYNLTLVLSDRGLSVTKENSIFIKILGYKFKVTTEPFRYSSVITSEGFVSTEPVDINISCNRFYSPHLSRRIDPKVKIPRPLLSWYIFGNMGFTEAMSRYSECEFEMGKTDTVTELCRSDQGWHVMKGYGGPLNRSLGRIVDNDFAIAIRNKNKQRKELSPMGLNYAASLLYVSECCSTYFDMSQIDNPSYWRLIIGRCSVKSNDPDEYIIKLMNEHFDSVDEYLDDDSIKRFRRQGIDCSDMYDLLNYISIHRGEIVQTADRGNMLGKELTSIEHTLDVLLTAANGFNHDVKNTSDLTQRKVERLLTAHFKLKKIDHSYRSNMELVNTPTDCPMTEHALRIISQDKVNPPKGQGSKEFDPMDSANLIHASIPFVTSYLRITEPNPDGRGHANPCIYLENDKVTSINPDLIPLYESIKKRLEIRDSKNVQQLDQTDE
ncbi:polymerase [Shewanella phage FishSpeaker]|nr:polymerase [Shewanella phage FishSpeaker]